MSRMLKKWSSELSKDQVVQLIDDRTLVQLNIELVSNDALAAQSARFAEERLGVCVPQGAGGPGVAGPSGS